MSFKTIPYMGDHRNFSRGGKASETNKNGLIFFGAPKAQTKILTIFRRFRLLKWRVIYASAEEASEKFRVFCTERAYDVTIFKFQGGGQLPQVAPLRAPMNP